MKNKGKLVKTLVCLLLAVIVCFGICGCSKTEENITSIEELNGKTIVVVSGSTQEELVGTDNRFKNCTVIKVATFESGLALIEEGKANAVLLDEIVAEAAVTAKDGFSLLPDKLGNAQFAAAFPKGSSFLSEYNEALAKLKQNGTLDKLKEKWLVEDVTTVSVIEQDWTGSKGRLICLNDASGAPMGFKDASGKSQGLDIDIALAIAKELDYKLIIRTAFFDDIIPSIMNGQADFAQTSMDYTEERAKLIDFSDGYLDNSTRIVVRGEKKEEHGLWNDFKQALEDIFLKPGRGKFLFKAFLITNEVYFLTMIFSVILGFGLFLLYYTDNKAVQKIIDLFSNILCYMPASSWLLVCFYAFFSGNTGMGIPATVFALTCMFGVGCFRGIKGLVSSVDIGQREAAYTMGYKKYKALFKIIIPQALAGFPGVLIGMTTDLVKATALVGSLYVIDIQAAFDQIRAQSYESVFTLFSAAIFYTIMNAVLVNILKRIKLGRAANPKSKEEIIKSIGGAEND